jgi:hypothetical protein
VTRKPDLRASPATSIRSISLSFGCEHAARRRFGGGTNLPRSAIGRSPVWNVSWPVGSIPAVAGRVERSPDGPGRQNRGVLVAGAVALAKDVLNGAAGEMEYQRKSRFGAGFSVFALH